MKKRTALFRVLKKRLTEFVRSKSFFNTKWIAFAIVGAIIGFNLGKTEPIPLTQEEIEYYTSQAEVGFSKGISYLDDNIEFIPDNNTTAKIYTANQPDKKQKLTITFSNNEIVNVEPYYSYWFFGDRIAFTIAGAIIGAFVFLPIEFFFELIENAIISIKEDMNEELNEDDN